MALVWPPGLPTAPLLGSYTKRLPKTTIRSSVDAGFDKVRRRYTAAPTLHDMSLKLTRTQVAIFRVFFTDTTQGGALPFTWKDPETGDACDFRFVDEPKLKALAPRQSGTEYWETEVFTLEQLPPEDSDDGGIPPTNPFVGLFEAEDEPAAIELELEIEENPRGWYPTAAMPTPGYYPWLIQTDDDSPTDSMTSDEREALILEQTNSDTDTSEGAEDGGTVSVVSTA